MRKVLLISGLMLTASALGAQNGTRGPQAEIRPFVGAYIPTGGLRDRFETATMVGAQGALELSQNLHVLGTLAWTDGHNKFGLNINGTHIWQYDIGGEFNLVEPLGGGWMLRPFAGLGAGFRTYDFKGDLETKSCSAGYGALGSELQKGAVAFRLEARDYALCYQSPVTGKKSTRSDLGISFGIAYHVR
jgi:hypothetical protein